jgi:hypothetical protein
MDASTGRQHNLAIRRCCAVSIRGGWNAETSAATAHQSASSCAVLWRTVVARTLGALRTTLCTLCASGSTSLHCSVRARCRNTAAAALLLLAQTDVRGGRSAS